MTKLLAKDGEGERLDRFELIAEIASGGMATVFLARLSGVAGFQRLVAIKRLHPHLAREPEFVEMFLDEARLAARIHHPNVVPIQEVGESELGYYLVMDYVEGDTLARVLARAAKAQTRVPYAVTIRVLLDVLAGLHAAHEMRDDHGEPLQIVHRDVSPQNVLVGVDGVARVVDFGVARAASRLSTTRSGQLKGKLAYMAPEQARGGAVDRRADIFACGIVLWEALATKRLFKGDGEAETLNRVLYDSILPPSSVRADVPKPLEDICMRALARDPDARFATAQDFGDQLERAARALGSVGVGSVRDVAECLQEVIGVDLSQQREAVRAWLARSEPSDRTGPRTGPRSKPALDSVVTRVESGSSSAPSSSAGGSSASRPGAITAEVVSPPSERVSSVSSAILQVSGIDVARTGPSSVPVPSRARTGGRIALALVAAVVLIGVGAWGAKSLGNGRAQSGVSGNGAGAAAASGAAAAVARSSAPTEVPSPTGTAAPSATGIAAVAPTSAQPETSGTASSAPSASGSAPGASTSTSTGTRSGTRPPTRSGTRPTPNPPTPPPPPPRPTSAPDDLGTNPYR